MDEVDFGSGGEIRPEIHGLPGRLTAQEEMP